MTGDRGGTLLGSVQRAIALIDIVANAQRPLPVKAIAQASGLTLGTTYNIVRTLVYEGFLLHEPDGLVLGPRFPGLLSRETDGVFLARVRTALRDVSQELGATAYLSRLNDGEIEVVDIVEAPHTPRVNFSVGVKDSAHATALGKRILAELGTAERLEYLSRHPLTAFTANTISDTAALMQHLDADSRSSTDVEEYSVGQTCLAVPVRASGVIASLAISAPMGATPIRLTGKVGQLHAAASRLSLNLGADGLA